MVCKIDETVKLIDELIESEQWIKYNKKSGLSEDNKKLKEAIAKLKSFQSLKMQSQSDTTPGSDSSSSSNTKQKSNNNSKFDSDLDSKIASKLAALYSEIEVMYLNGQEEMRRVIDELSGDIAMFQLSKKRKDEFEQKLRKARPDLDSIGVDKILNSIEKFSEVESNGNEKLMKRLELLALHWTIKGNVILPEDGSKVIQALKIAEKNKFDVFSYNNPNDIIESFAKVEDKTKPLDPDDYIGKGYSNRLELTEGVVVYDVDNTDTGRKVSRAMIDTHFGKDANPWCLLARKNGGIEFSSTYWYNTYPGKKKIAFHNGKLVAFYGGDKWWDRMDKSSSDIAITKSGSFIEGESTVKARFLVNEELKEVKPYSSPFSNDSEVVYEKGENKLGKSYHGWNKDKVKVIEISPNGSITEWYPNGKIKTSKIKKEGSDGFSIKSYYESGALEKEQLDGFLGDSTTYYENGSIKEIYKNIVDSSGLKFLSIEYDKDGYVRKATYPNRVSVSNNNIEFIGDYSSIEDGAKILTSTIGKLSNNPAKRVQRIYKDGTFVYYYDNYKKDKEFLVERVVAPDGTETLYDKKGRVTKVTDSEGKVTTNEHKDGLVSKVRDFIGFQEKNDIIKGAAVIDKRKILIDISSRSTDTLAHEYAHFYIAGFRDTPIVQEAIKRFGGEEELVQAIGEEVVKRKGEAYDWWKQFSEWLKDLVANLDRASKEKLISVLTDAFLTNTDLSRDNNTTTPGSGSEVQSYKPNYSNSIDVDAELKEKIKSRLSETYKNVDLSKITLASSNAAINFLNNNSIENVPYQYADVYIDVLRNTTFVNNTINNISKYKNISIVDAEKLLIESIGKNYIEYFKNGIGDKYIASYARKIWNFILDFFGKFDNTINEINIISERFFNGENSDAISYYPKKGFERVNTELTFKDQPFAGNVLKTIVSSDKFISFTGSASLALQGDIYRKGKNGITDLHDLDFIVHGEKALDAAKHEIFKNFSAFEIYDFGLSNGRTERISTLIVVPKEYKIPRNSIQRNKNLRVISYKIYDSENNVVGTYNATVDNNGQIESENTTGFKAVIVDLMQESKDENEGTMYYSDTLKTEIKLANPDDVFKAKNDIGKDIPRNKDILDSTSFYKSNRYKQFSKDDIEAAKDIMAKNKKECE